MSACGGGHIREVDMNTLDINWLGWAGVIVPTVAALAATFVSLRSSSAIDELRKDVDAKLDGLRKDLDAKIDGLRKDFDGWKTVFASSLSQIVGYLQGSKGAPLDMQYSQQIAEAKSPVVLTAKGRKIAEALNAQHFIEKYHHKVQVPEDADELQIQEVCFNFVSCGFMSEVTGDELTLIRKEIYNQGGKIGNILIIFAILLRDKFLEDRGLEVPAGT